MTRAPLLLALALALAPTHAARGEDGLTVDAAVARALATHPDLRAAEAAVEAARGRLTTARTYRHNPAIELGAGPRYAEGGRSLDAEAVLSQELEVAGQRSRRTAAARGDLEIAEAELARRRREVATRTRLAFVDTLEAAATLEVVRADRDLASDLARLARRRLEAGAATRLDLGLAEAELARARGRLAVAQGALEAARSRLAETLGATPETLPALRGDLGEAPAPLPALPRLLEAAEATRADLAAAEGAVRAARSRVELARAEAWPNLTVRAFATREGPETVMGAGVGIPLPLFDRNQGAIVEARAEVRRAEARRDALRRTLRAEVEDANARLRAAEAGVRALVEGVVTHLEENLTLLERAFEEGKRTWVEVLVLRRAFTEAERDLVAARAEARRARARLDLAAGLTPLPDPDAETPK